MKVYLFCLLFLCCNNQSDVSVDCEDNKTNEEYILEESSNKIDARLSEINALMENDFKAISNALNTLMANFSAMGAILSDKEEFSCPEKCPKALYANDADVLGGGWIVVMRRLDGSVDFYRNWDEYKRGFGDFHGEFFIGLEMLHAMTSDTDYELLVILRNKTDNPFEMALNYARYNKFVIGSEEERYVLKKLGTYTGTAGDSLTRHVGNQFSTKDKLNKDNCADKFKGAWWFHKCFHSHLFGKYMSSAVGFGIRWNSWTSNKSIYSLQFAEMLIRPVQK